VFGKASLKGRVGVFSFARYSPLFWKEQIRPFSQVHAASATALGHPIWSPNLGVFQCVCVCAHSSGCFTPCSVVAVMLLLLMLWLDRVTLARTWQGAVLKRACKVLSHEITHMFNAKHCTFFRCRMNGSNG